MPLTYVQPPKGKDVLAYLGLDADDPQKAQADIHAAHIVGLVRLYVRGQGFDDEDGWVCDALATVIVTAAARTLSNPAHAKRLELGNYSEMLAALEGFTLAERNVLHHFRRRTA